MDNTNRFGHHQTRGVAAPSVLRIGQYAGALPSKAHSSCNLSGREAAFVLQFTNAGMALPTAAAFQNHEASEESLTTQAETSPEHTLRGGNKSITYQTMARPSADAFNTAAL